jgi:hypothetical protein
MSLNKLLQLQGKTPVADPAAETPAPTAPKPGGLAFLTKKTPGATPVTQPSQAEPAAATALTRPEPVAADLSDPFALANLDLSSIGESTEREIPEALMFADLIDAKAPERELPPEITVQQMGFVNLLDSIYDILVEPELFGQAVRTIMSELQTHTEYAQLVGDKDVHTLIRGMRQTMGLARVRKAEKKAKAPSSRSNKKPTFDLGLDLGGLGL